MRLAMPQTKAAPSGQLAFSRPRYPATALVDVDPRRLIDFFLAQCIAAGIQPSTAPRLRSMALQTIAHLRGTAEARRMTEAGEQLLQRWYNSLTAGEPDWSVYAAEYYLAELWACWSVYSRKYLSGMRKPNSLPPKGIIADLQPVKYIVDLGCGIGFTTAALRQMFPMATIAATNFGATAQSDVARQMAAGFWFSLHGDIEQIRGNTADLVFASEYFEHLPAPLDHLDQIVACVQPRALLIANAFGARAIGHFESYQVNGRQMPGDQVSRAFNEHLRDLGYRKVKTGLWNQRPAYWKLAA